FVGMGRHPALLTDIVDARVLWLLLDSITTAHLSPPRSIQLCSTAARVAHISAPGSIRMDSPAGKYLTEHKVKPGDFNQYGTRRGNHEVMMRGTFANIRIKNFMLKGADGNIPEGGLTRHWPDGEQMSIYDAAMKYQQENVPLVVFAGAEYGNGSSRDSAPNGTVPRRVAAG